MVPWLVERAAWLEVVHNWMAWCCLLSSKLQGCEMAEAESVPSPSRCQWMTNMNCCHPAENIQASFQSLTTLCNDDEFKCEDWRNGRTIKHHKLECSLQPSLWHRCQGESGPELAIQCPNHKFWQSDLAYTQETLLTLLNR